MNSQLSGVTRKHSYTHQIQETTKSISDTYQEICTLCSGINKYILEPLQFLHGSLKIKLYVKDPTQGSPFPEVPDGTVACSVALIPQHIVGIGQLFRRKNENWGLDIGEKVLQVVSKIGDIAVGIMSSFKLTDTSIALISYIAKEIGSGVAVIQTGISSLAPFTAVFTGIQMAKTVVDIGIDSLNIYRTSQKVNNMEQKITLWEGADWTNSQFASGRLEHLKAKQLSTEEELEGTKGALGTAQVALESAVLESHTRRLAVRAVLDDLDSKNKIVQVFGAIAPKIKLTIAEFREERARTIFKNRENVLSRLKEKHTLRQMKIASWDTIKKKIDAGLIGPPQREVLNSYKERQIEKLKAKKSNLNLERVKIGLDIALKVVVVASLVASMVLLFSGVGTGAGVITAITLMLFIMAAEYGLKKFKECYPSKTWQAFRAPAI